MLKCEYCGSLGPTACAVCRANDPEDSDEAHQVRPVPTLTDQRDCLSRDGLPVGVEGLPVPVQVL